MACEPCMDEADIASVVTDYLHHAGYEVEHFFDGSQALAAAIARPPALAILDLMLPGVDGLEICRRIRQMSFYLPVIIISARTSETHRVLGLEMGADDYLAKPFSVLELMARVKALFRRQEAMSQNLRMEAGIITVHGVEIDPLAREVRLHGKSLDLTPREFDLLYFFARHPGEVFSRQALLDQVWGYQHEGYEHTVNSHINRLRTKIEKDAAEPEIILTVWGRGYKLAAVNAEHQP